MELTRKVSRELSCVRSGLLKQIQKSCKVIENGLFAEKQRIKGKWMPRFVVGSKNYLGKQQEETLISISF